MKPAYVVPTRCILWAVFVLALSATMNIVGIVSQLSERRTLDGEQTIIISCLLHTETNDVGTKLDYDSLFVKLPISIRRAALTFHGTPRYDVYSDDDWESLIPQGHGFYRAEDTLEYYGVSMYHQLHCLDVIRRMITAKSNTTDDRAHHADHCLSYLRQAILCHSDLTLEPAHLKLLDDGRYLREISNMSRTHDCHDWVQVREFLEERYLKWEDEDDFSEAKGGYHHIL